MFIAILGKTPKLSLAELASLYPGKTRPFSAEAALIDADEIDIDRLGGTIKIARLTETLPGPRLPDAMAFLREHIVRLLPESSTKLPLGLSFYASNVDPYRVNRFALELKKILKNQGLSPRIIPNKTPALNAAQILHNKLLQKGAEIIVAVSESETLIGRTLSVQDIEDYGHRDYGRPKRSAKVGMLPPKLAQIMLNLTQAPAGSTILDPFCGTGVILQEALLMGYRGLGSDIDERMVGYTRENLDWLTREYTVAPNFDVALGDATRHSWREPIGGVVSELYLGKPLYQEPHPRELEELRQHSRTLLYGLLKNLQPQLEPRTPLCLAIPVWQTRHGLVSPDIDQIEKFGYNRKSLNLGENEDLVYIRPQQFVGRKLLVLTRE